MLIIDVISIARWVTKGVYSIKSFDQEIKKQANAKCYHRKKEVIGLKDENIGDTRVILYFIILAIILYIKHSLIGV